MNIGDLLGSVLQSGVSQSTTSRIESSLGGGGILGQLGGLLGGVTGGAAQGSGTGGGGILDSLGGILGGATGGSAQGSNAGSGAILGSGSIGGALGNLLNEAGKMVGGNQNLALGGLGALAGALLGGKKGLGGALRGGIGGGAMAMLGIMAYQALKKSGVLKNLKVPLGLAAPKTAEEKAELERHEELVLKAMINAAKADGRIEESEISRIVGKVQENGASGSDQAFLKAEMAKPMQTASLVAAARGKPELAAELYAASLLAIEVDTPSEKAYLEQLAGSLGLNPAVTQNLHQAVGLTMG
jgi:uncharacterized membrane protein YebE (DUF533 family)